MKTMFSFQKIIVEANDFQLARLWSIGFTKRGQQFSAIYGMNEFLSGKGSQQVSNTLVPASKTDVHRSSISIAFAALHLYSFIVQSNFGL